VALLCASRERIAERFESGWFGYAPLKDEVVASPRVPCQASARWRLGIAGLLVAAGVVVFASRAPRAAA
jgi:hypothetical protein